MMEKRDEGDSKDEKKKEKSPTDINSRKTGDKEATRKRPSLIPVRRTGEGVLQTTPLSSSSNFSRRPDRTATPFQRTPNLRLPQPTSSLPVILCTPSSPTAGPATGAKSTALRRPRSKARAKSRTKSTRSRNSSGEVSSATGAKSTALRRPRSKARAKSGARSKKSKTSPAKSRTVSPSPPVETGTESTVTRNRPRRESLSFDMKVGVVISLTSTDRLHRREGAPLRRSQSLLNFDDSSLRTRPRRIGSLNFEGTFLRTWPTRTGSLNFEGSSLRTRPRRAETLPNLSSRGPILHMRENLLAEDYIATYNIPHPGYKDRHTK